jgi:transketolase
MITKFHPGSGAWIELRRQARLRLLQMHFESGVGHIGGNLSCLDMMLVLHHDVFQSADQFVLSKGHAAGAYYVTLWTMGRLRDEDLRQFHRDGTYFGGHPPAAGIEDILFATGSLGHGLSLAAGLALGKRLKDESGCVFCLMSDGEWNEGSCWEALIFARHHHLDNLKILVDSNGLQGFGTTKEVANLERLAEKLWTFGVPTEEIDGHDPEAIRGSLGLDRAGLSAVVARTHKGCGVSFMEDRMEWHYLPMTESQYLQAAQETEQTCAPSFVSHLKRRPGTRTSSS